VDDRDARVSLSVPADPTSIAVVRAVVASVASTLELPYDAVDDLRIAAAEACAMVLSGAEREGRLCVELTPDAAELRMRVWREGGTGAVSVDREGLGWRVIEGLTDGATVGEVDGHVAVELQVRTLAG
jgi:anti-sigma regulatory factor (Ser/Thr protein kinase)